MNYFEHPQYLPAEKCYLTLADAIFRFRNAFKNMTGISPSDETLSCLLAQSALETEFWKSCWNWNFGNIRINIDKIQSDEYFTMFVCNEVINNKIIWYKPGETESIFRAFKTPEEGIKQHFYFKIKDRYWKAWEEVLNGNPSNYAHELKIAGYYTAGEKIYTNGLVGCYQRILKEVKNGTK
jgi:flagellum-specific peptidoglycan hydrolase FlgJ